MSGVFFFKFFKPDRVVHLFECESIKVIIIVQCCIRLCSLMHYLMKKIAKIGFFLCCFPRLDCTQQYYYCSSTVYVFFLPCFTKIFMLMIALVKFRFNVFLFLVLFNLIFLRFYALHFSRCQQVCSFLVHWFLAQIQGDSSVFKS